MIKLIKKVLGVVAASALAKRVFPFPGGPSKHIPRGARVPHLSYNLRSFTAAHRFIIADFALDWPPTSAKVNSLF